MKVKSKINQGTTFLIQLSALCKLPQPIKSDKDSSSIDCNDPAFQDYSSANPRGSRFEIQNIKEVDS